MPTHRSFTPFNVPNRNDWRNALYNNDLTRVAQWLAPDGALVRNLNVFDTGESLLHWAATMDRPDMVALMLRYGSPNQADQEGQTPLMTAASAGALATVKVLLPVSDPSRRDHQGRNALHLAAGAESEYQAGIITVLLERFPARAITRIDRRWALHEACNIGFAGTATGVLAKLDVLLPFGGTNRQDASGQTPIMLAMASEHPWRAEVIARLAPRSNLAMRNRRGQTALDIARGTGDPMLIQILEAAELRQAMAACPTDPRHRPRLRL